MTNFTKLTASVAQFHTRQLPGQPAAMHMGTFYLVNDLWVAIRDAQAAVAALDDMGRAQLAAGFPELAKALGVGE